MKRRIREEAGFGLIELLIAMVMLNVGILALVAAFNSGIVALSRSSQVSTAAAIADQKMELYRGLTYDCIYITAAGTSANWTGDSAQAAIRGRPILGDDAYGATRPFPRGIALHARALTIRHPVRQTLLTWVAPLPAAWSASGIAPTEPTS